MATPATNTLNAKKRSRGQRIFHPISHNQPSDEMMLVQKELLALTAKQQELETKQAQTNNHIPKSTNDTINNNVLVTMEKTSNDISDIRTQMIAMEHLTSNVSRKKAKLLNNKDDMMIDKDANKRNLLGTLRDSNGNIQANEHNKEIISAGGNQNKCTYNETDYVGNYHP
jgi:hypothetical protein